MNANQLRNITSLLLVFVLVTLIACSTTTPHLDAKFGDAVELSKAQQTINPDASLNTDPVMGINGQAGDAVVDNYRDSFRNPQAPLRNGISVGTTGGSSGGMEGSR